MDTQFWVILIGSISNIDIFLLEVDVIPFKHNVSPIPQTGTERITLI